MTLPSANPALPSSPNPYFQDNAFVRGDQQRANNGFIWNNLENLDTRVTSLENSGASLKRSIEVSKRVGEPFYGMVYETPAAWNPADPDSYFPAICLDTIESTQDINVAVWPKLVPKLRGIQIKYLEGRTGEVASWSSTISGSNITLPNNTSANALLLAFSKNILSRGGYTNWISATVGGVEYPILNVNTTTRVVQVFGTPPSGTQTVTFFPHRISGSTTTARLYEASGKSIISPNDAAGLFISGMQMLGYFQGHWHAYHIRPVFDSSAGGPAIDAINQSSNMLNSFQDRIRSPITDTVNGTPRTSSETHSPSIVAHLYVWAGEYTP